MTEEIKEEKVSIKEKIGDMIHRKGKDNGSEILKASQLEALRDYAKERGINLEEYLQPQDGNKPQPNRPRQQRSSQVILSPESASKLISMVCSPDEGRECELTDLTLVQSELFPCSLVFEQIAKKRNIGDPIPNFHEIYRHGVYGHRRSKDRWFASTVLALAGIGAEEEQLDKEVKAGGFGH